MPDNTPAAQSCPGSSGLPWKLTVASIADGSEKPDEGPWYRHGLRFECTQCGNCCTGLPGYVWVEEADIARIAEYLNKPIGEIRLMRTRPAGGRVSLTEYANGDCTFFDAQTRRCTIYPVRPPQCRAWPFWQSHLLDEQTWAQTERDCPGAGCGNIVPLEEIERLAADPRL